MNAKDIEKKLRNRVKEGAIQKVINYFYYANEFLNWLESKTIIAFQGEKKNFANSWEHIIDFETIIEPE